MTTGRVKLLVGTPRDAALVDRIRAADPRLDVTFRPDLLWTPRDYADHHTPANRDAAQEGALRALLAETAIVFDIDTAPELATGAPRLRWVQATSAGIGQAIARSCLDQRDSSATTAG